MDICVPKFILGGNTNILITRSGRIQYVDSIPSGTLCVGTRTYNILHKLYNLNIPKFPAPPYIKAYRTLLPENKSVGIPWKYCIPPDKYEQLCDTYISTIKQSFERFDFGYFLDIIERTQLVFDSLSEAKVNRIKICKYLSSETGAQKNILEEFLPRASNVSYARTPTYSRTGTITGRLQVVNGPNILHLKKELRDILESRWGEGGNIWYLDYASLEPRVMLSIERPELNIPSDIYTYAIDMLSMSGIITRDVMKNTVIKLLYGAGIGEISDNIKNSVDYPAEFIKTVKDFFAIDLLRERLLEEYEQNNNEYISNYFGRPIWCKNTLPYVLVNYYIQSTAVDISLLGFTEITKACKRINATPIYVLHDAIIIDAPKDIDIKTLAETGTMIPGFEKTRFHITCNTTKQ